MGDDVNLKRVIVEVKPDGHELRVLYRRKDGPNPGTVRRRREVEALARDGLTAALAALDAGDVEMIGTAGFITREDTVHAEASPFLPNTSNNCLVKGEKVAKRGGG